MPPANRKELAVRSARDQRLRKGIPSLAEMAPMFASEEAAVTYLLAQNVLTVPNCPTCGRQCRRRGVSWVYRCQADKFTASLVSLADLSKTSEVSKMSGLTNLVSFPIRFFLSASLVFTWLYLSCICLPLRTVGPKSCREQV
jgi:hypothetical protein